MRRTDFLYMLVLAPLAWEFGGKGVRKRCRQAPLAGATPPHRTAYRCTRCKDTGSIGTIVTTTGATVSMDFDGFSRESMGTIFCPDCSTVPYFNYTVNAIDPQDFDRVLSERKDEIAKVVAGSLT